jgi:signal transduction histidine kinase
LTGATALIVLAIAIFAPALLVSSLFMIGVVMVFAVTALAIIVPWARLHPALVAVLPIIDIAAIGFMRGIGDTVRLSILLILPVIWLASSLRIIGAVVGTVLGTIAAWGASFTNLQTLSLEDSSRVFLVPLMLAFVGATMAGMAMRAEAQQGMLARQGELLEEALQDAKRHRRVLDGILDTVDFGIIGLERDGTQSLINRSSSMLLGITQKTVDIPLAFYEEDRKTRVAQKDDPLARARAGETFQRTLLWLGDPSGEQAALNVSAQQITDETGRRTGAVVVFQDVTAEIEALRSREELVAAVSHELRTPLTSIVGYLELALDTPGLPDEAHTYTRIASESADRMLQLISDLLVASSSVEGKLAILRSDTDLGALVLDAVEAARPRAADRAITVDCTIQPGEIAFVDELRMRQVVDNVLSNAIKYGRHGGTVTINSRHTGDTIVVDVIDDGMGISLTDQERLFDRFYRSDSARRSSVGGAGLGLSISRAIMREHGGDVRIDSELGVGTTASIVIPGDPAGPDAAGPDGADAAGSDGADAAGSDDADAADPAGPDAAGPDDADAVGSDADTEAQNTNTDEHGRADS